MNHDIPVYQSIARSLKEHEVPTLFGLMGDANLFMVDHYVRELDGHFISAAHEASCVLMAAGHAQVTGGIGVATVTHGPALTNCITALVEATRGHTPMVLLAGDTPAERPEHTQNIDQRELVKTTGAGFEQMRAPRTAAQDVARAFFRARAERRPIVLNMPVDFMWETVTHEPARRDAFHQPRGIEQSDILDEAVGMIASARRPLILAGGGARGAEADLIALADRLEAPLANTVKGNGLFRDHPYSIGFFGTLSTPAAYEVMGQADCIVAFGASLNYYTTDHGALMKDSRLVQVDINPAAIGNIVHPDAAIVSDAGPAAKKIHYWLDEAEIPPSGFTKDIGAADLRHYPDPPDKTPEGRVNYVRALQALDAALPDNRIFVTDVGRFMLEAWVRIRVSDPSSFVPATNFTSIGLGLPEAIGAAVAAPDRPVLAVCGDGGFMMGAINELHTAIRLGLDLVVVVANDGAYGAEHIQFANRQMDPASSHLEWPSLTGVAAAMGAKSFAVTSDETLTEAVAALSDRKGVVLIELMLDPGDMPIPRV